MSCRVKCSGFSSVRDECARDPCLARNMCHVLYPDVTSCASWCCENRSWYVFFMVFFFCLATFALCAAYYVYRLHTINLESGAVGAGGEAVVIEPAPTDDELAAARRKKRSVTVDPQLLQQLNTAAAG